MNVFDLRDRVVADYAGYVRSFVEIQNPIIRDLVERELASGLLWPQPLLQLNPAFEPGRSIDALCDEGVLHPLCAQIFRRKNAAQSLGLNLHRHQDEAIEVARTGSPYVLTTGTGSGKSLAYIVPIVDSILRRGPGRGVQAIIVYPMNALANSQMGELQKFLHEGFSPGRSPLTFERYTGQEGREKREQIIAHPPDILLTNFVMLELMLTRKAESRLLDGMSGAGVAGLRWLVLDEMHTYRGRQGSDVAVLVRRAREMTTGDALQCVGTSATIAAQNKTRREGKIEVARVASQLFGVPVQPEHIIGETLRRATKPCDLSNPATLSALKDYLLHPAPENHALLASWIENTFGLSGQVEDGATFLKRADPRALGGEGGAAQELADLTRVDAEICEKRVRELLLSSSTGKQDGHENPSFAFRLHQWVSRGDTVYATLEPLADRFFTMSGQTFAPGNARRAGGVASRAARAGAGVSQPVGGASVGRPHQWLALARAARFRRHCALVLPRVRFGRHLPA